MPLAAGDPRLGDRAVVHTLEPTRVLAYSMNILPNGQETEFELSAWDTKVRMRAKVARSRPVAAGLARGHRYELELTLIRPDEAYLALFERMRRLLGSRRSERLPAALQVEFIQPPGLAAAMTRNIAEGGAWIVTDETLREGALAVVRIAIPGVPNRLHAVGRVVRVKDGGVGLAFVEFHDGDEALQAFLERTAKESEIQVVETTPASRLSLANTSG